MVQSPWHASLLTLFPEMFPGILDFSLAKKARENKIWDLSTINIRDFGLTKHKNVDDTPFGGGPGMLMRPDVVHNALEYAYEKHPAPNPEIIFLSPRGVPLQQYHAQKISENKNGCILLCGHFEGIDQRVIDHWIQTKKLKEFSIGDYVLSGGESAAFIFLDVCIRLLPGVLGAKESLEYESFNVELLEFPQYTRPRCWLNYQVPDILFSGHHEKIRQWRLSESKKETKKRRPDLLK